MGIMKLHIFCLFTMMSTLFAFPIFSPCATREEIREVFKDEKVYDDLNLNFKIVSSATEKAKPISAAELFKNSLRFLGRRPTCETERTVRTMLNRIPQHWEEVSLKHKKRDSRNCREFTRTITYIEKEKDCHDKMHLPIHRIKTAQVVVGYQYYL